jgi:hypothetical protein
MTEIKHPVELLRDRKGVYGIGVAKEAVTDCRPSDLILRRDHLVDKNNHQPAVLQMITGGFRHGMFANMSEEKLRQVIHRGLLSRRGFIWPPSQSSSYDNECYWSPRQQILNRRIYHGLRLGSLTIINHLIGHAHEEAADLDAVKIARRFGFHFRYGIYRAATLNPRALQLAEVFPALALAIFSDCYSLGSLGGQLESLRRDAMRLVDAGAPFGSKDKARGCRLGSFRQQPA